MPPRYEIRVRGPIGPTVMQAFPCLTTTQNGQDTLLTGSLPDQSALYGVIHQLEALGLPLLEIRRLADVRRRSCGSNAGSDPYSQNAGIGSDTQWDRCRRLNGTAGVVLPV